MEALEIGGAIAIALGLVEIIKLMVYKLSGKEKGPFPSPDGYIKEVVWRERTGKIIKEQHQISKELQSLLQGQNDVLQAILDLLKQHDKEVKNVASKIDVIQGRIDSVLPDQE